ncbi:helix-turn-helix protein [Chitinophaga skermanii]|uniref:Helix-turn-helix protein n=1 Tax=Chitinophaga skermanii TaxID=331697 RepID=A0A327QTY7_9BACT|nr:helix-turn-helix domain-containing protein [Chitinophaga skermanii]RAJ05217.1 helix-turn-helix protein [Chitinophaga skermanii]
MAKPETVEQYYSSRPFIPKPSIDTANGHFNVFRLEERGMEEEAPIVFGRKNYFKICLTTGKSIIHYADKSMEIQNHGLFFANPQVPYNWEPLSEEQTGYSCIFTETFFENYGRLKDYPVFKPGGVPVYELTPIEYQTVAGIFSQLSEEKSSNFEFRDDVLRNLVFQLVHHTLKMRPAANVVVEKSNAANRIAALFTQLLEKQFPIKDSMHTIELRSASDFAQQLAVHVNHLNKSIKQVTDKTTSEIIMDRLLTEAKILLKHSSWTIAEISYALGFEGPTHFSSFFRKHLQLTPTQFRKE